MRKSLLILGFAVGAALVLFWAWGGLAALEHAAVAAQRDVQNALAGAIRRLRTGQPGAVAALLALSFGYGFFHAVGPGHGKMLIGAYGMGSRVRLLPLAAIAILSSVAQATFAVLLVYSGVLLLGWTRERLVGVGEDILTPVSYAAIATLGAWLALRGLRGLRLAGREAGHVIAPSPDRHHDHDSAHHDRTLIHGHHTHGDDDDADCGHTHGPTPEQLAQVHGWRDALALIAGIAIRPCTGALFVLILTWQMGIGAMGILSAYAMGLGTASVTLAVAGFAVWAREGAFAALPGQGLARALPVMELAFGSLIALVSLHLLLGAI